jgi:hypothetical protein
MWELLAAPGAILPSLSRLALALSQMQSPKAKISLLSHFHQSRGGLSQKPACTEGADGVTGSSVNLTQPKALPLTDREFDVAFRDGATDEDEAAALLGGIGRCVRELIE